MNLKKLFSNDEVIYLQTGFSETIIKADDENDVIKIKGYASTTSLDSDNDKILPEAFSKKGMKRFKKNPQLLLQHNMNDNIGLVKYFETDKKGLKVEADVIHDINDVKAKIRSGTMRAFSIGFRMKAYFLELNGTKIFEDGKFIEGYNWSTIEENYKKIVRVITDLEMFELSVVSVPANPDSTFTMINKKSLEVNREYTFNKLKFAFYLDNNSDMKIKTNEQIIKEAMKLKEQEDENKKNNEEETVETKETDEDVIDETKKEDEQEEVKTADNDEETSEENKKSGEEVETSDETSEDGVDSGNDTKDSDNETPKDEEDSEEVKALKDEITQLKTLNFELSEQNNLLTGEVESLKDNEKSLNEKLETIKKSQIKDAIEVKEEEQKVDVIKDIQKKINSFYK